MPTDPHEGPILAMKPYQLASSSAILYFLHRPAGSTAFSFLGVARCGARQGRRRARAPRAPLKASSDDDSYDWRDSGLSSDSRDSNQWRSIDEPQSQPQGSSAAGGSDDDDDWQDLMKRKQDGSFWSSFEPTPELPAEGDSADGKSKRPAAAATEEEEAEAWLDTIASLSAEEVEFNLREADRADKVRQMQEWGFTSRAISSTLGVATDLSLENREEVEGMQAFREESYLEEVDLETAESHARVEIDEDTGEPVRNRMVYVDEHTCIGCTNCAMIAQSTFFMHSEHGRARVFNQWGDDDETIQIAIETCPVDCIHYVPYDELVKLEIDRRGQNMYDPSGRW
jgi:ferredoxin